MESGEVKAEQRQRQPPVTPKKRKLPKPEKSAQANGGSSSSAAESSPPSRTSSSSPPSNDADGKGLQQQQQQGGGGGKRPRLVWTDELHDLFVKAYDSLGDEAVPRRILEKMNEKMNVPEVSREKVASHLQKHKLHLRRLAEEAASSHSSPTEEAPAAPSHPLRSLPPNTTPLAAEVSQAQLELLQVLQTPPPDCLSRSSSSIATNLQIVQSIQQQLLGPPIKEQQAKPAQTMQRAPADSGSSPAAILVPEANTEAVTCMAQAAKAENAAEAEKAAPTPGSILAQFWASPDNEGSSTCSWDIFGLSHGT
ncbi:hypothetical protein BDA96_03G154000 [Sorghum bicolor]|uniref:HTH myb-type domain-containing protein n=2 Tax=Sorghum bicolor TaxID=4558 RepID=A0A921RBN7_SORBI|nr:hypothetical protein BDA96_03G154000 [Sorghum bicolor]